VEQLITPLDEAMVHVLGEQEWRILRLETENARLKAQIWELEHHAGDPDPAPLRPRDYPTRVK
jgi:hypothetical protein